MPGSGAESSAATSASPSTWGSRWGRRGESSNSTGLAVDLLLPLQEAEKLPQGGEAPGPAAGRQPPGFLGSEIVLQVGEGHRAPVRSAAPFDKYPEILEIPGIGRQGQGGQAPLHP